MRNNKKIYIIPRIVFMIIVIVSLSGCYKSDRLVLKEGVYEYVGDNIQYDDSNSITSIKITFIEISKNDYDNSNSINVIPSPLDEKYYSINFEVMFNNELNYNQYQIEYVEEVGNIPDAFKMKLLIKDDEKSIDDVLSLVFIFDEGIPGTNEDIVEAKVISLASVYKDNKSQSFPSVVRIKEESNSD